MRYLTENVAVTFALPTSNKPKCKFEDQVNKFRFRCLDIDIITNSFCMGITHSIAISTSSRRNSRITCLFRRQIFSGPPVSGVPVRNLPHNASPARKARPGVQRPFVHCYVISARKEMFSFGAEKRIELRILRGKRTVYAGLLSLRSYPEFGRVRVGTVAQFLKYDTSIISYILILIDDLF